MRPEKYFNKTQVNVRKYLIAIQLYDILRKVKKYPLNYYRVARLIEDLALRFRPY